MIRGDAPIEPSVASRGSSGVRVAGLCVLIAALLLSVGCGGSDDDTDETASADTDVAAGNGSGEGEGEAGAAEQAAGEEDADDDSEASTTAPIGRIAVRLYVPVASRTGLATRSIEIFDTTAPGDRAKQILSELASGEAASAVPRSARLRQVYVLDDGTAWADFSSGLRDGLGGGSSNELLCVYAIVNSLAMNIEEIERVGILIEGKQVDTLKGHVDITDPLRPDLGLVI